MQGNNMKKKHLQSEETNEITPLRSLCLKVLFKLLPLATVSTWNPYTTQVVSIVPLNQRKHAIIYQSLGRPNNNESDIFKSIQRTMFLPTFFIPKNTCSTARFQKIQLQLLWLLLFSSFFQTTGPPPQLPKTQPTNQVQPEVRPNQPNVLPSNPSYHEPRESILMDFQKYLWKIVAMKPATNA